MNDSNGDARHPAQPVLRDHGEGWEAAWTTPSAIAAEHDWLRALLTLIRSSRGVPGSRGLVGLLFFDFSTAVTGHLARESEMRTIFGDPGSRDPATERAAAIIAAIAAAREEVHVSRADDSVLTGEWLEPLAGLVEAHIDAFDRQCAHLDIEPRSRCTMVIPPVWIEH